MDKGIVPPNQDRLSNGRQEFRLISTAVLGFVNRFQRPFLVCLRVIMRHRESSFAPNTTYTRIKCVSSNHPEPGFYLRIDSAIWLTDSS
jgi:hypothetical protein